jgi:hypothetical protein
MAYRLSYYCLSLRICTGLLPEVAIDTVGQSTGHGNIVTHF